MTELDPDRRHQPVDASDPATGFRQPRVGTPVMQAAQTMAINLPFKALAWQDERSRVWLSFSSTAYLAQRHCIATEVVAALSAVTASIAEALQAP